MRRKLPVWLKILAATALFLPACQLFAPRQSATPTPTVEVSTRESPPTETAPTREAANPEPTSAAAAPAPAAGTQPAHITGIFTYSNDIITTYNVEHMVALVDMYGFITRNKEWVIPVQGQTLGFMKIDEQNKKGTYSLDLPEIPQGQANRFGSSQGEGVQVFSVSYWPNLSGGPYSEGDDKTKGWPDYLASVITDTENKDEVTGGKLVVWAPDASEQFPTGFGADGLLFTSDDPLGPIPAGYSIIDLDQKPFAIARDPNPELTLYEPKDIAIKDYSSSSYSEAFKKVVDVLRKEYAFNDVPGKAPNWDDLYNQIAPRVADAEKNKDARAFYLALQDFTLAFKDGHVGLNGGQIGSQVFSEQIRGGYGLTLRELDDKSIIVTYILSGGPADRAGIKKGAVVTEFNGKPIAEAVSAVHLPQPFSLEAEIRYQQVRYLTRATLGTEATIAYTNPGSTRTEKARLKAVDERDSFRVNSLFAGSDPNALPVEYKILPSGAGYIKVNSNLDDLNLIVRLFERALKTFQSSQVPGIIIDMRQNAGGYPLGLAGYLTDLTIKLGQLEYYSEKTGKFEPEGPRDTFEPKEEQYQFGKEAVLVAMGCASACEIESYGFSQVPGMIVVGQTPTAGIEAEVARGQFLLPEGMSLQVPTGRFKTEDGKLFLEGQGVPPTLHVPIDAETATSDQDVVLKAAEDAVTKPEGAGIPPSGPPQVVSTDQSKTLLQRGTSALEDLAKEQYSQTSQAGETYSYTIRLDKSQPLLWLNGWCASDSKTMEDNYKHITMKFTLDGKNVPRDQFASFDFKDSSGNQCRYYIAGLDQWPGGEHHLSTDVTFDQKINDGSAVYPKGTHTYAYTVFVKP
ncbi:MAG TPA: S41 family peptidase [Anaerolineaceae bacterium]|nr:S41 family peptidase [Anaerolineaceae bacterium]